MTRTCSKPFIYRLLFTFLIISCTSVQIMLADPVEDFRNLIISETDEFVLEDLQFDEEELFIQAAYLHEPTGLSTTLFIEYDSTDKIREHVSSLLSQHKIHHAFDREEFFEVMDYNERRDIPFDDLVDQPALLKWQINHSTFTEDYPVSELYPASAEPFGLFFINQGNPKAIEANYDVAGSDSRMSVTLYHGVAAEIYHTWHACNFSEHNELEVHGIPFFAVHREIRGDYEVAARAYFDDVLLEVTYRYGDDYGPSPDEQEIDAKVKAFLGHFNFDQISSYNFPVIDRPADGIEPFALNANEFANLIPEPQAPLTIQNIESYDDAMHIRVDYYHEPDDFEFSSHFTYRDYHHRVETPIGGGVVGNFRIGHEFCIREDVNHFDYIQLMNEPEDVVMERWEMENIDLSGYNPIAAYFPVDFGDYSFKSYSSDAGDLRFTVEYVHNETDEIVALSARYGDSAAEQYNRYHLVGFEEERHTFETQGMTFNAIEMSNNFLAFSYFDHLLIEAGIQDVDEDAEHGTLVNRMSELLQNADVQQFSAFEAPADYEMEFTGTLDDGTSVCLAPDCIDEHLSQCEPAAFGGQLAWNLGVVYQIEDAADGGQCRMSMQYTRNPNDEWVEQPLYFYLDQDDSFSDSVREIVDNCMGGETEAHNCHGPLLDLIE